MTYLQDKRNRKLKYLKISFSVLLLGIIFFGMTLLSGIVSPLSVGIINFGKKIPERIGLSALSDYTLTKSTLLEENRALKLQLEKYSILSSENVVLTEENSALRNILNSDIKEKNRTLVRIYDASSLYGTALVDAGKDKNISTGRYILGERGGLVGIVQEVYGDSSRVIFLDSDETERRFEVQGTSIAINAKGDSRGSLRSKIPRDLEIQNGQIVTLGNSILVGVVVDVSVDERNPYKTVLIRLFDNVQTSKYFYIIN